MFTTLGEIFGGFDDAEVIELEEEEENEDTSSKDGSDDYK